MADVTAELMELLAENPDPNEPKPQDLMRPNPTLHVEPRVKVYNRMGEESWVPRKSLAYHLTKTDEQGNRAFFSQPPEGAKVVTYIDQTCEVCLERGVRKKFTARVNYVRHMRNLHPDEWEIMEEEQGAKQTLREAFAAMTPAERKALLGGSDGR